jgi:hypothetical protein
MGLTILKKPGEKVWYLYVFISMASYHFTVKSRVMPDERSKKLKNKEMTLEILKQEKCTKLLHQ